MLFLFTDAKIIPYVYPKPAVIGVAVAGAYNVALRIGEIIHHGFENIAGIQCDGEPLVEESLSDAGIQLAECLQFVKIPLPAGHQEAVHCEFGIFGQVQRMESEEPP